MCNFENGFKLCTCDAEELYSDSNDAAYIWTLYRYMGKANANIRGKYQLPTSKIGKGLTAAFVLAALNIKNCFDFDYQPSEGDNLIIRPSSGSNRMEFIFRKGAWIEEYYTPFSSVKEAIDQGKMLARD